MHAPAVRSRALLRSVSPRTQLSSPHSTFSTLSHSVISEASILLSSIYSIIRIFHVMAMFSTPKQAHLMMQPSVFPTPPLSSSKPLFYSPIMRMQFSPKPLPFSSPAATPPPEQKDIPSQLYLGGYPMVAEKVFSCLSGADLSNCLQVCKTWNQQVSTSHYMAQVKTYRRHCKENAENLHKSQTVQLLVAPLKRTPLVSILPNKKAPVCCTSAPHSTHSVIQKVNFRLREHFEFSHGGECSVSRSLKRPRESEAICCSKKRLRRL